MIKVQIKLRKEAMIFACLAGITLFSGCKKDDKPNEKENDNKTPPGVVINFTAIAGDKQVVLNWGVPVSNGGSEITCYEITMNNWTNTITKISSQLSHTYTGLNNGTQYTFKVRAVNSKGVGAESVQIATPTENKTTPGVVINFTATAGDKQVFFNWGVPLSNGGSEITGYEITRDNWVSKLTKTASQLSHTYTGLNNGTQYTFRVRAVNSKGAGAESVQIATPFSTVVAPIANFTYSPTQPIAPCTINLTNTSSGNPTNFQWQLSNTTVTSKDAIMYVSQSGTYSVQLTVSNSAGSNSITKNIKVYDDCEANNYGWIKFTCISNYSYDLYINDTFTERIAGKSSSTYKLGTGTYNCRVEQVSGYIFYPTIESKSIKVESCNTATWNFPSSK